MEGRETKVFHSDSHQAASTKHLKITRLEAQTDGLNQLEGQGEEDGLIVLPGDLGHAISTRDARWSY